MELDQKFTVEADTSAILTVEFSGLPGEVGFVKVGRNSDYCDGEVTRDVICTEESGEPIGSVKFKLMMGCINNGVITRVFFENECNCFIQRQRRICKGLKCD